MTKTPRPKRAHLERDLIVAQQQRDRALERAEAAEAELARRDNADRVKPRPLHERVWEGFLRWLDELAQAVGAGGRW